MRRIRFGENLRRLRLERGLTQRQLAELVKYDRKRIGWVESGKGFGNVLLAASLADALGVTLDELVYGTEKHEEQD